MRAKKQSYFRRRLPIGKVEFHSNNPRGLGGQFASAARDRAETVRAMAAVNDIFCISAFVSGFDDGVVRADHAPY
jgi:hypothetical protein